MHILLLGSGGREHALAWKIAASPLVTKLWCAPGNAGIAREAECVALDIADHAAVIGFCKANAVDLVVVGPETPLAAGIVDDLAAPASRRSGRANWRRGSRAPRASPRRSAANLPFRPALMAASPTPADALAYIRAQGAPIVVKADGLAAGKGVVVAKPARGRGRRRHDVRWRFRCGGRRSRDRGILVRAGRSASSRLSDGDTAMALATAQDHKRVFDHDQGPNTGGMGAYSPTPFVTANIHAEIMERSSSRRWPA
jgi:phosphoribosylamine--glycine ligase